MIYSQATTYSLEALAYLASAPQNSTIKARDLARTLSIPEYFLGKLLSQLVKKRFVKSSKGPTGGFSLAVDPDKITLYRILAAIDSLSALEEQCVMGLKQCSDETSCALHDSWIRFKRDAVQRAQELTLSELARIILAKLENESNNGAKLSPQELPNEVGEIIADSKDCDSVACESVFESK